MEEKFIKQIMRDVKSKAFGSRQHELQVWYNKDGDCVQFKTVQVATLRRRVDEYLTLYISIDDKKPVGFQLKDWFQSLC